MALSRLAKFTNMDYYGLQLLYELTARGLPSILISVLLVLILIKATGVLAMDLDRGDSSQAGDQATRRPKP